jgi:hypothetical protein
LRIFAASSGASRSPKNFWEKIQSIYNGKRAPIAMQGPEMTREKPPAQQQWKTMEKTTPRTMETVGNPGAC